MSDYDSILADASALPVDARIRFIDALWNTVPDENLPPLSEEWIAELQCRSAEHKQDASQAIAWEQVRADARRRAGLTVLDEAR
jgi:putative addiction module component (TIGR02574 family)